MNNNCEYFVTQLRTFETPFDHSNLLQAASKTKNKHQPAWHHIQRFFIRAFEIQKCSSAGTIIVLALN